MDTEYIIDCAMQLGEVTPLEGAMLSVSRQAYTQIRKAVDSNSAEGNDFVANTCRQVLGTLNPAQQAVAGIAALCNAQFVNSSFGRQWEQKTGS